MNPTESLLNNGRQVKKDYQTLHKVLKKRCEEIAKDNDALSSRLINLKLLIHKAENQCRKLQSQLEIHGVDYNAAAALAASAASSDFANEMPEPTTSKPRSKHPRKKRSKPTTIDSTSTPTMTTIPPSNDGLFQLEQPTAELPPDPF